jgi:hypothetical protein
MAKNTSRPEIDSLSFEVENQELSGKSGSGWFTGSFECTTNNVKCG